MKKVFIFTFLLLQYASYVSGQRADTFDVYFDRNAAALNSKGTELISKLVTDGVLTRGQKLILLGYADYLGTNGHNDSLSVARAKKVEGYLIKMGFNKKDITLCAGKGKIDRALVGKDGYSLDRKVQVITERYKKGISVHGSKDKAKQKCHPFPIEMVTVKGNDFNFAIGKYDITEAQWSAVMGHNSLSYDKCDSCPVTYVSWKEMQEFLQQLNSMTCKDYRLPSEAEWEYAAKGGINSHNYAYAGSNDINEVAWYEGNSGSRIHPVGQKKPNELGIYDMSGNVWQWCTCPDPARAYRVLRGGAYFIFARYSNIEYRSSEVFNDTGHSDVIGFRVVCPLGKKK